MTDTSIAEPLTEEASHAAQAEIDDLNDLAGKFLTFKLGEEEYGLEILKVREIIGLMDITDVPRTPEFIRGVINLRGKIIPVIDLRRKFGMHPTEDTELTCIIVVDVERESSVIQMGILVDSVCEVLDINDQEIEPTPSFGADVNADFILGMAKCRDEVKILLNVEDVLNSATVQSIANLAGDNTNPTQESQDQ